jgi:signal transduction histidine kinase
MEALMRRTLGETIDVTTHLETGAHWAFVDGSQSQNALLNLVINARDAMPDGGALIIDIETVLRRLDYGTQREGAAGRYAQITVTDTGVGMSRETQQRVFEPFFTTKPVGGGTGLGLSMVYGFAKQSSGFVELSSEPRKGHVRAAAASRLRSASGERRQRGGARSAGVAGRRREDTRRRGRRARPQGRHGPIEGTRV